MGNEMAATRLIPLHVNKGRTVAQCLSARTDYAKNPEKTEKGEMVTAYECDPMTVDEEFLLSKRQYEQSTSRRQKNDIIAYQIRQSFSPERSRRRKQIVLVVNLPCGSPKENTLSS